MNAIGEERRSRRTGLSADRVYAAMRRAIIEQALAPGTKLPEDSVGESFGVSRTVVRSVLARLAVEGLVNQEPNRRAQVASPTLEEARDVFRVRCGLERTVVESLTGQLNDGQVRRLKAHVDAEQRSHGRDGPESIRLAGEFHLLLAELTGNDLLIRYVSEVVSRCSLILALYGRPHSSDCAVSEHGMLIDALARGDTARAVKLMDDHLLAVASRALLEPRTNRDRSLKDILASYGDPPAERPRSRAS